MIRALSLTILSFTAIYIVGGLISSAIANEPTEEQIANSQCVTVTVTAGESATTAMLGAGPDLIAAGVDMKPGEFDPDGLQDAAVAVNAEFGGTVPVGGKIRFCAAPDKVISAERISG